MVEGVRNAENAKLDEFLDFSLESVKAVSASSSASAGADAQEGHFALKLTAYISTDVMEKLSQAQDRFVNEVIQVKFDDPADDSVLSEA